MPDSACEQVAGEIDRAATQYHRLLLVAPPARASAALRDAAAAIGAPVINLNLEIARRLLDRSAQERRLAFPGVLDDVFGQHEIVLLDHIEILFDAVLKQDPLRLLRGASRTRTLAVAWPGASEDGFLIYAVPGHPEHRRYARSDLTIVNLAGPAHPHQAPGAGGRAGGTGPVWRAGPAHLHQALGAAVGVGPVGRAGPAGVAGTAGRVAPAPDRASRESR